MTRKCLVTRTVVESAEVELTDEEVQSYKGDWESAAIEVAGEVGDWHVESVDTVVE